MQSAAAAHKLTLVKTPPKPGDLVQLATPVLTLILEIRAGVVQPSSDLRRTVDTLLKEMERTAQISAHSEAQVQATKFALAAFADETVLTATFPLRDEWEKYPLQLEYFGEQLAGVKFFERLEELMKVPEENADVIEVYYLCLLIGYKGKYKIYLEEKLKGVIENVAESLRRVNRLQSGELSPHWKITDQPERKRETAIPTWAKVSGVIALSLLVLFYLVFRFWLNSTVTNSTGELLR